jgi:hypothetical protein
MKRGNAAMQLIRSINGEGWLRVGPGAPTPARYLIGVWRDPDGQVFGAGHISGAVETMCRAALQGGLVPLVLGNGQAIGVIVTDRGLADDWGEIYVPHPSMAEADLAIA